MDLVVHLNSFGWLGHEHWRRIPTAEETKPYFFLFLLILCYRLACCSSEAQLFEVPTLLVQGDLHSLLHCWMSARTLALSGAVACTLFLFFSAVALCVAKNKM